MLIIYTINIYSRYLPAIHPVSHILEGHVRHVSSRVAAKVDDERVAVHLYVFVNMALTSNQ